MVIYLIPRENFALQYKETDWQFLKRTASHFGTILVAEGIEVHSQQPLSLKADQDLQFTGRRLTMNAGESMHFTCDASSLVLDGITDIQGDIVAMNGSLKAPISLDEEAEGVDELELGLDVGGMIPLAGGADG